MKSLFRVISHYIRHTDRWLWLLCLGLSAFSVVLLCGIHFYGSPVNAASVGLRTIAVQAGAAVGGAACAVFLSTFDYKTLGKLWKLHVPAAYGLVLLTFVIGVGTPERPEDRSWLRMPGGMTLQPTELLKISFILAFAYHLYILREQINRPQNVLALCLHGAAPVLLVHFQGDDGTALAIAIIFIFMIFAAGVNWRYILAAIAAVSAAAPLVWMHIMNDDQRGRILALFMPDAALGYQQDQARLAIGSGLVWGKGIFADGHVYVPIISSDFMFSFIAESLGFVGSLATIAAIIALCCKLLHDARLAEDTLGRQICIGVFAMIAGQSIVNIGMNLTVLPVIGITLAFLSYGGSSVLASYLGIGIALSVYMHSTKNLFSGN